MSRGISWHVRSRVLAALYAGKTTTIRFPWSINRDLRRTRLVQSDGAARDDLFYASILAEDY
jgi:hypothetical protein